MSLRSRLVIGMVALAAVGLLVLGAVTYGALRDFELGRVDDQASAAVDPALQALREAGYVKGLRQSSTGRESTGTGSTASGSTAPPRAGAAYGRPGGPPLPAQTAPRPAGGAPGPGAGGGDHAPIGDPPPSGTFAQQRDATGKIVGGTFLSVTAGEQSPTAPTLPAQVERDEHRTIESGGRSYRIYAVGTPTQPGETTVVAIPFAEAGATLNRLLLIEALVIAAVLAALGGAVWWIVRLGLRPLDRIGDTAGAIAGGDLARRVEPAEPRTEVGRLGLALNAMLARLEEAFAERRASEERLRRFLADASHELRTPLASIRGYAELFRIGAAREGPEMDKAMSRIEAESARMGVLVEDLLALARLDEVRDLRRERVDLAALAADAVDDARAVAPDREIALHVADAAGASSAAVLDGDPGQLRQVLANLVRNALVHTPAGTPIEVAVRADGEHARLEVRDHGPGLPEGDPAELFERFWRADPGRGRGRAGAGLGLSIVAAIVAAHGGRAQAADAPDGGARFTVTLPLRAQAVELEEAEISTP
ncbi:MAG TPA: HAMP domain-containing sensor histidine kinase [Solirubrobacteraceae bacterium]|jgi:two-component system OmpR family sensor kinase|nr:HAMP domain-containing sensor histidine kinase [Solirubrobacteraceae bacterium]